MKLEYFNQIERDPYHLDGKTYGIAYHNDTAAAAALTAQAKTRVKDNGCSGIRKKNSRKIVLIPGNMMSWRQMVG